MDDFQPILPYVRRASLKNSIFPRSDLSQIVGHIDCMMRRSLLTDITNQITTLCCYSFHKSFSPSNQIFQPFSPPSLQGISSQTVKSNLVLRERRTDISDILWHLFSRKLKPILTSKLTFPTNKLEIMKNDIFYIL